MGDSTTNVADRKSQNRFSSKVSGTCKCKTRDRNRRRRMITAINKNENLTRGQKHTGIALLERSCDHAKPSYGNQQKFADEMGISASQMWRDMKALEREGLIKVTRFKAQLENGHWTRPHCNTYCFNVPEGSPNRQKRQLAPISRDRDVEQNPSDSYKTFCEDVYEISFRPPRIDPMPASEFEEATKITAAKHSIRSLKELLK